MSEQKAVAVVQQHTVQDIRDMASAIAKSGLFGIKTAEQGVAIMLVAQAQGRHPATVAMEYDIIQNKPALKSQAALMRFQEAGGKIEYLTRTDKEVSAKFSHPMGGTLTVTWDMERAKKMGLADKDNWKKQPMIMLQWRVVAEGVRACYPACLGGSYLVEEVQDFDTPKGSPEKAPPRDITPPTAPEKARPTAEPAPSTADETSLSEEEVAEVFGGAVQEPSGPPTAEEEKPKEGTVGNMRKGYVKEISFRPDKNKNKRFKIETEEGEEFFTYEQSFAETAKACKEDGKPVTISFKDEGKFGFKIIMLMAGTF